MFNGTGGHRAGQANRARPYFFKAAILCRKRAESALGGQNRIGNDRTLVKFQVKVIFSHFPYKILYIKPRPFSNFLLGGRVPCHRPAKN